MDGGVAGFGVFVCDVFVGGSGGFEGEADEFAAPRDGGVVEEFVGGEGALFLCGGHCDGRSYCCAWDERFVVVVEDREER